MMKKVSSTISYLGVIGLAFFALAVATLVWLFERARGDDVRHTWTKSPEVEWEEDATLENGASLACEDEAGSNATTV